MASVDLITWLDPTRPYKRQPSDTLTVDFAGVSAQQVNITGIPNQDSNAANLGYIRANAIVKPAARVATMQNINTQVAPGIIDGVTLTPGDFVLLLNEASPSQNGLYQFNNPGVPLVRPSYYPPSSTQVIGTRFPVIGGSYARVDFILTAPAIVDADPASIVPIVGAGASIQLDNLANTAINADLMPALDDTITLGDGDHRFKSIDATSVHATDISAGLTNTNIIRAIPDEELHLESNAGISANKTFYPTAAGLDLGKPNSEWRKVYASELFGSDLKLDSGTGYINLSNNQIGGVHSPLNADDAVNKAYVDNLVQGLSWKNPVRVATVEPLLNVTYLNETLTHNSAGGLVIDGVALNLGDRVLVKDQPDKTQNGLYQVISAGDATTAYFLERDVDADTGHELEYAASFVESGSSAGKAFVQTTYPVTLATSDIKWVNFTASALAIGFSIAGSTGNRVLFIGPSGVLAESGQYTWDDINKLLTVEGTIRLQNTAGNHLDLKVPNSMVDYAITYPAQQGAAGSFLKNDGAGNLVWAEPLTETFILVTLTATDITNKYVVLPHLARTDSIQVAISGTMQRPDKDFHLNPATMKLYFGGTADPNSPQDSDLDPMGGEAALVPGDSLEIYYNRNA